MKEEIKNKIMVYVSKQLIKEKDKWESGMKNDYFSWQDAYNELWDILMEGKR